MKKQTWITAHSDAEGMPQNSMEFLQYALQTAADVIEVDVHRDPHTGALVLTHDWEEGGAYVSLEAAFIMVSQHPSMRVNCDLKEAGLEPQVIGLAKKLGITERLIFSGTVDPEQVPLANREQIHWNIEEQIPDLYQRCQHDPAYVSQAAEEMCKRCIPLGIRTINVYHALACDSFLDVLERSSIGASVWVVDEPEQIRRFLSRGVCSITTCKLSQALSIRQQMR